MFDAPTFADFFNSASQIFLIKCAVSFWGPCLPLSGDSKAINQLVMRASKFIITRQRGHNRGEGVIMLWRIMARRKDIGEVSPEFVCMPPDECVWPE